MHDSVMKWVAKLVERDILPEPCNFIIEVGAYNVNGSVRDLIEKAINWRYNLVSKVRYVGTDMRPGPGVDVVLPASNLWQLATKEQRPDLVVCTEMLEHAEDWENDLRTMCDVLRLGGGLILTTRSPGFPKHDYPEDYWRFTRMQLHCYLVDMGMRMISNEPDHPSSPGALLYYVKDAETTTISPQTFLEMGRPTHVQ